MRVGLPASLKKLSDSKPKAAPESAQARSSMVRASIAPLAPPAGTIIPSSPALGSVVGLPSLSSAQPREWTFLPARPP